MVPGFYDPGGGFERLASPYVRVIQHIALTHAPQREAVLSLMQNVGGLPPHPCGTCILQWAALQWAALPRHGDEWRVAAVARAKEVELSGSCDVICEALTRALSTCVHAQIWDAALEMGTEEKVHAMQLALDMVGMAHPSTPTCNPLPCPPWRLQIASAVGLSATVHLSLGEQRARTCGACG